MLLHLTVFCSAWNSVLGSVMLAMCCLRATEEWEFSTPTTEFHLHPSSSHLPSHPLPFTLLSPTLWPWSLPLNLSRASYFTWGSRDRHTFLHVTPVRGNRLLQTNCFDLLYNFNNLIKTYLGLWKSIFEHNGITWMMFNFCRNERVCARETVI